MSELSQVSALLSGGAVEADAAPASAVSADDGDGGASSSSPSATSLERPQILEHAYKSFGCTVFDTKWVPSSARFVALGELARGTGFLHIYALSKGKLELLKEGEKKNPFKCSTFRASSVAERHFATGDYRGMLAVWDPERLEYPVWSTQAHDKIINAVDGIGGLLGGGAPEIVTASRDGTVKVWDPRQRDEPVALLTPAADVARDCWCVAFGNSAGPERCVVSGYDNGDVKMLDLRTGTLRWETNVRNGVCGLQFDRADIAMNKLVATTLESRFVVWDLRTFHPEKGFASLTQKAHESTVWCVSHLPQNRDVWMTSGGNGTLSLWKYSYPPQRWVADKETGQKQGVMGKIERLQSVTFAAQPVVSFDWHADKEGLAVCASLDQTVRVGLVTRLSSV